ncbi:MAG: hypothetical protein ACOH5I_26600 [Oligoflexus sp.]
MKQRRKFGELEKKQILEVADAEGVSEAAVQWDINESLIHKWRAKRDAGVPIVTVDEEYLIIRVSKKVVAKELLGNLL